MKSLIIYDGNNWFRRRAERDLVMSPVSHCFNEIQNDPSDLSIVIWDGQNALKARRAIYPEYKMKRTPPGESIYESQNLLKKLLTFSRAVMIDVPGYEADDIIAIMVEKYKDSFDKIHIRSNDLDLYQLGCTMDRDSYPELPQYIQIMKTFVGDPSDNIPGCKGFGKTTWAKLTEHQKQVLQFIIHSGQHLTTEDIEKRVQEFFPKNALKWFLEKENLKTLRMFYRIVGFIPVPMELVNQNMVAGINQPHLAQPILNEFMI